MTREVLDKYISHMGMVHYSGATEVTQVFIPHMCMDAAYQIFSKEFLKHIGEYRHEPKKWLKMISKSFLRFFTKFSIPFTEEDLGVIGDDQDKFFDYISDAVDLLRTAYSKEYTPLKPDEQKVMADIHVIHLLASCADTLWEDTFHSRHVNKGDKNTDIEGVQGYAKSFARAYIPMEAVLNESSFDEIDKAETFLCTKIAEFTKNHQQLD